MNSILKRLVFVAILTSATCLPAISSTIYVNDAVFNSGDWCTNSGSNAVGTGSTSAPYATLGFALGVALPGDVIRVDVGTYNNENNLNVTQSNLVIEGYNIATVVFQRTSGTLNFLNISAANATVKNITVQNYNSTNAATGKAITVTNVTGALIYNCYLSGNSSGGGEPAVYVTNTGSQNVSVTIRKCSFRNNGGNYGGAISLTANTSNVASTFTATIDSCYFENNSKALYNGGAVLVEKGLSSAPSAQAPVVTINNSTIGNLCASGGNHALRGGAIYADGGAQITMNNCCVSNNSADDNVGPDGGGAIWSGEATLTINDCKFENNTGNGSVAKYGGAICANGGFNNNSLTVNRTAFIGNVSNRGGGIYVDHCTALLNNCLFYGNSGTSFGGGIACNDASAILTVYNSTFSNNTTTGAGRGGAIDGSLFSNPMTLKNCIIYNNGAQREVAGGTNIRASWCDIGTSSTAGVHYTSVTGNTTANPLFTNAALNDYTLASTLSPAYNTANTDGGNAPANDINALTRTTLEMGCYRFGSTPVLKWNCANPVNIASINGSGTQICAAGSVTLTATPASGYTYSWTSSPAGFTSTSASVTVSPTVTTVYTVALSSGSCGIYGSASYTVTVNALPPVPTIAANGPTTFCAGDSVILTSSSAGGNVWSTGQTTQSITVLTAGSYSVTVTNIAGCTASSASTTVTVNSNPATPTVTASGPTTFCQGDSVTLTSSSATNNSWSTGATTQSIVVNTAGTYTVTVSNISGCTASSAATTINVNANPVTPVITASGPTTFCSGDSITLTSSSAINNVWSTGATSQSIVVTASGNYLVTVNNAAGCTTSSASASVTVNVNPATPAITANGPTTFCVGDSVTLTSSSATNNLWSTGATTNSIVVYASGTYSVTVTNVFGCSSTSSAAQVIANPAAGSPTITANGPTTFCQGDSVVLSSASQFYNQWSTGDTTAVITVFTSGVYSLSVSNLQGCVSGTVQIAVNVNTLPSSPSITASGPLTFCAGDSVTLSAGSGSVTWSTGASTTSIVVTTAGTYSVYTTDGNGCQSASSAVTVGVNALPVTPGISTNGPTVFCAGDSLTLTSSSPVNNHWSTGDTTQSIVVYSSGNYSVYVTNSAGCSSAFAYDSVQVNSLPSAPQVNITGATTFCLGDSVVLTSSYPSGNIWSTGATSQLIAVYTSGAYTVSVTDSNGCSSASAPITITANPVPPLPIITASGSTTLCQGQAVSLTSSNQFGNLWSTGDTTQTIVVNAAGQYTVSSTNTFGCSSPSASVAITVNPSPVVDITSATTDTSYCGQNNGSISGVLITTGTAPYTYNWYDATGNSISGGDTSLSNLSPGSYYVIVTDANGCADTSGAITVQGSSGVQVLLSGSPLSGNAPVNSFFSATATEPVVQYFWSFGNGSTAQTTTDTTSFQYLSSGTYTVTVTVTDVNGCTSTDSLLVTVEQDCGELFVPNIFSPNGDLHNDELQVYGTQCIENFHWAIYDRWGELVFETTDPNEKWDGSFRGKMLDPAVFVYRLNYTRISTGEAMESHGNVTLVK